MAIIGLIPYHARDLCSVSNKKLCMQVSNVLAILPSPYPKHGLVEVINQTTQVINSAGAPVPLSEVCVSKEQLPLTILAILVRRVGCGTVCRLSSSVMPLAEHADCCLG